MNTTGNKNTIVQSIQKDFELLKDSLLKLIPRMSLLSNKDWKTLKERCCNRYNDIENINEMSNYIFIEYAIGCNSSNVVVKEMCKSFISSFNELLESSILVVPEVLKDKLLSIIRQIFITGENDMKHPRNSDFKNRLNELLVFSFLSQCENFDIVNFEESLPNRKSVDFLLKNKNTGGLIGIEILTLQTIDPSLQDNDETLTDFLDNRIISKYEDKTSNIQSLPFPLFIMPIVEYNEGLEDFRLTTTLEYATPIMISCLNDSTMEILEANKYLLSVK